MFPINLRPIIAGVVTGTIWSPRFPLCRAERLASISPKDDPVPRSGGVYCVYLEDLEEERPLLAYVGQTGRLRGRLNELANGVFAEQMPFTTPHVAAPSLYAWAHTPPYAPLMLTFFEVDLPAYYRQGLEDFVLAFERQKRKKMASAIQIARCGYSALANFGRMPKGWCPSTSRERGRRGGPTLVEGPWHIPSIAPVGELDVAHSIFSEAWGGHAWSAWQHAHEISVLSKTRGLYRLWPEGAADLWYIGWGDIATAAREIARVNPNLLFSAVPGQWRRGEMEELKSDLLGLYVYQRQRPPLNQYDGEENGTAGNPCPELVDQGDEECHSMRGA